MEQKFTYPDFSAWKENAIHTDSGTIFAPEDFYVLDEQGRKKEFFTWDEAMKFEEDVLRPNGWRLPTKEEWRKVVLKCRTSKNIRTKLCLGLNGIIWWGSVEEYNKNLDDDALFYQGILGFYWSSTRASGTVTYYLFLNYAYVTSDIYCKNSYGGSVRCVVL